MAKMILKDEKRKENNSGYDAVLPYDEAKVQWWLMEIADAIKGKRPDYTNKFERLEKMDEHLDNELTIQNKELVSMISDLKKLVDSHENSLQIARKRIEKLENHSHGYNGDILK